MTSRMSWYVLCMYIPRHKAFIYIIIEAVRYSTVLYIQRVQYAQLHTVHGEQRSQDIAKTREVTQFIAKILIKREVRAKLQKEEVREQSVRKKR